MPTATMVKSFCYADLTDEAKAKAREMLDCTSKLCDAVLEQRFSESSWDDIQDDLNQFSEWGGFPGLELRYDFSFSQGCGVGFSGSFDAIDADADDWTPILAMLGANRERHVLGNRRTGWGGIVVSWPRPILSMTVKIDNDDPWFNENRLELAVVYAAPTDPDWPDEEEFLDRGHPVFSAVASHFRELSQHIYEVYSTAILDANEDDERVSAFFDWNEEVQFCRHGYRIDELDQDEIDELEETHA